MIFDIQEDKEDEAKQNLMVLAFIGNKGALIKGSQYSNAARLHSGGNKCSQARLSKLPDQLIRIQLEDVS